MDATIPIINLKDYLANPNSTKIKLSLANEINYACSKIGFFYISGHGISDQLRHKVLELAYEFFQLPIYEKEKIKISNNFLAARGYQRPGSNITKNLADWHEGIDFYREMPLDETTKELARTYNCPNLLLNQNKWPNKPSKFKEIYTQYIDKMLILGQNIMNIMALSLNQEENYFSNDINQSFWVLRAIGYPPLKDKPKELNIGKSCGEHTDYGCLTILNQDSTQQALQVKTKENRWMEAPPIEGTFLINIGDMFNIWTQGQYKPTLHRVIHRQSNYRVSVPFFFEPNFTAKIKPVKSVHKTLNATEITYGNHLINKIANNFAF